MRKVLVTGGTRGIGAAIALKLKEQNYHVIATYNSNHEAAKTFSSQHNIPVYSFNVAAPENSQKVINEIIQKHGAIDSLVHNSGITKDGFFHKMTYEKWHEVIATNLLSCFQVTQPLINDMREKCFGRIIYISSINAFKGQAGQTNYSASKAGLIGFAKSLALENASKGITVNTIAPGYTDTEMVSAIDSTVLNKIIETIPAKRLATSEEVAESVAYLLSDKAGYITGTTLHINGGMF